MEHDDDNQMILDDMGCDVDDDKMALDNVHAHIDLDDEME